MRVPVASLFSRCFASLLAVALVLGLMPAVASADAGGTVMPIDEIHVDREAVVSQEMVLSPVAQAESTKSFLLAQTLESAHTVPVVSAKLPIDDETGSAGSEGEEGDGSFSEGVISSESVVVGSFESDGIVYAVEPGGESVAVVAVDYGKLPQDFLEARTIDLPSMVLSEDGTSYSVTRITDAAFSSLNSSEEGDVAEGAEEGTPSIEVSDDGSGSGSSDDAAVSTGSFDGEDDAAINFSDDDPEVASGDDGAATIVLDGADVSAASEGTVSGAFAGIEAVSIPASVTSIEEGAFDGSGSMSYIVVADDNQAYSSYDGCLYDKPQQSLLLIPEGRTGAVRIASSAIDVDPEVFSHCPSVDEIVADADSAAFTSADGCLYSKDLTTLLRVPTSAASLTLAFECSSIGPAAFSGCNELVSIAAPGKVDHVDATAFKESGHRADLASSGDTNPSDVPSESFIEPSSSENDLVDNVLVLLADGDDELKIPWREVGCANFELLEAADRIAVGSAVSHGIESVSARSLDSTALRAARKVKVTVYGNGGTFDVRQRNAATGETSVPHRGIAEYSGYTNGAHGIYPSINPPTTDWWLDGVLTSCLVNPRSGYTFIGFSFSPDGGLIADGVSSEPYTNDVTIYCRWAANLQINGNGGTLTHRIVNGETLADNISVVNSTTILHTAYARYVFDYYPVPGSPCHQIAVNPRSGFEFLGWSTVASGDASTILKENLTSSEPITLFARWAPLLTVYGNGGTLTKTSNSTHAVVDSGKSVMTQRTTSLTAYTSHIDHWDVWGPVDCYAIRADRAGYKFLGWSYAPDSEIFSSDVTVVEPTAPITFYARWELIDYSIDYVLDGEISGQKILYSVEDADFTLPIAASTGYIFSGWDVTGASGAGVEGNGTTNVTIKKGTYGNLTATAKWTPVTYSVTYDEGGGSFSGKVGSYNIETADFTLPTTGTRTGYTFAGWDVTGASGAGVAGNGTTNVTIKRGTYGSLTAKAKWSLNTYHLSWDVSHGSHANRTEDFTVEDCPIAMGEATPYDGYAFTGWSGEKLSASPSSFTLDASFLEGKADGTTFSFTAGFSANPYTIRLHANDGTGEGGFGDTVEHAVTYDAAVADAEVPKRYGYAFSGYWTKDPDGSKGELYFDADGAYVKDAVWKDASDIELYACWTLMGDLEVPISSPSTLSFTFDRATGQASASDGSSSSYGLIRSSMPEEVPVASVALEALRGPDGTSVPEKLLGKGNPEECAMEVVFSAGASASKTALLRFASPAGSAEDETLWEFPSTDRPLIPSATSVASGTTGDDIVTDGLGNLARAGELSLSYALKTLSGFDVYEVPLADASEDAARIVFTVDLTGLVHERF